jgi:osmotically-inducible protein OsmY
MTPLRVDCPGSASGLSGQFVPQYWHRGLLAVLMGAITLLGGCAAPLVVPLVLGGAMVGGSLVATDRRTAGAQLEDEGIEVRANARLREAMGERAHISVASYNRQVLLTGEVPSAQDKQLAEQTVSRVENVRAIVNELGVLGNSTLSQRSGDSLVTAKVKSKLVDAKDLYANAFKVITERGTTYLLGRVTKREADRATEEARGVQGVQRLVRVLEIISEEELQRMLPAPGAGVDQPNPRNVSP